jgi:hypothetical protein
MMDFCILRINEESSDEQATFGLFDCWRTDRGRGFRSRTGDPISRCGPAQRAIGAPWSGWWAGGNVACRASFRVECATGQVAAVDPIVMPGHAGMSHFHHFYGNLAIDENTTAASLRAEPAVSC